MTSSGILSYSDLLSLYRGKAAAVEQLTAETRRALAIRTPLVEFIEEADRSNAPRHIVLAGSAGDGKSFAALAAETKNFEIVLDASQGETNSSGSPVEDLVNRIADVLGRGRRLLLAINRGQFERLEMHLRDAGPQPVRDFATNARKQAALLDTWHISETDVGFVDLGLLDTASDLMVDGMLDRVVAAAATDDLSPHTRTALSAAQVALKTPLVREYLKRVLRAAHSRGHHSTPRQLWSFFSFLATGARDAQSNTLPTLADAVGARLFSATAEGALFELAKELADPAVVPNPVLAKKALRRDLAMDLRAQAPGLGGLAPADNTDADGELLSRVAVVHGYVDQGVAPPLSFRRAVEHIDRSGQVWLRDDILTGNLLSGLYRVLGLWSRGNSFPAWETLCFDTTRFRNAASAALEEIDPGALRLAVPRPNPTAQRALRDMWLPPFVWLSTTSSTGTHNALRLTPRLLELIRSEQSDLASSTELLTLRRWLSAFPTEGRRPSSLRIARERVVARFAKDPLMGTDRIEREDS